MAYDQSEAINRFSALAELVVKFGRSLESEVITDCVTVADRIKHMIGLADALDKEIARYHEFCLTNAIYEGVTGIAMRIMVALNRVDDHLEKVHKRIHDVEAGKAVFIDMLGKEPASKKFLN